MFLRQKPAHEKKTKELARVIRESKVFQEYKEALRNLKKDEETKQIASEITKLRIRIQNNQNTQEDLKKEKKLIKQYQERPSVQEFMKARKGMEEIANEVNKIVSDKINMPFIYKVGGGTCSGI